MASRVRFTVPRLLVAALALGAGVLTVSFWPGVHERLMELWPSQVPESAVSLPPGTFTPIMNKGGSWYTSAGSIDDEFYLAWDGSEVGYSRMYTDSAARAAEQMRERITLYSAQEAVRSDVPDESGKKVGERVRGLRRIDTQGRERLAVLWTEGSEFFTIEGESTESVILFERKIAKE
jgi:hypothetical protein